MLPHEGCFQPLHRLSHVGIPHLDPVGVPGKVRTGLEQELRECIEERDPGIPLDKQELTTLVDLQENGPSVRNHNEPKNFRSKRRSNVWRLCARFDRMQDSILSS